MNSKDFVVAIESHVGDAAVVDTIANLKTPPGRRVSPQVRARSEWYNSLSEHDREHIDAVISSAVHAALFGMLATLDGARTIDDGSGRFELAYVSINRNLLNPPSINLHDLLRGPDA